MKKTLILITLTVFLLSAYAQENKENKKNEKQVNVPELVKKAFTAKHPKATKIVWSLEKQGEYEAEFKLNKSEMSVVYDEKGTLLEVETEIKESELPPAIKAALSKDFVGYKLGEVEKAEANNSTTYELEAKKGKAHFELVFDNSGKLLKKEEKKEKKMEDKD